MNFAKVTVGLCTVGLLGIASSFQTAQAEAAPSAVDVEDQVNQLEGLEERSNPNLIEGTADDESDYELDASETDAKLIELEEIQTWGNTGDDVDSAIFFDIYDF